MICFGVFSGCFLILLVFSIPLSILISFVYYCPFAIYSRKKKLLATVNLVKIYFNTYTYYATLCYVIYAMLCYLRYLNYIIEHYYTTLV